MRRCPRYAAECALIALLPLPRRLLPRRHVDTFAVVFTLICCAAHITTLFFAMPFAILLIIAMLRATTLLYAMPPHTLATLYRATLLYMPSLRQLFRHLTAERMRRRRDYRDYAMLHVFSLFLPRHTA